MVTAEVTSRAKGGLLQAILLFPGSICTSVIHALPTLVPGGEPPFFAQDLCGHHGTRYVTPGDGDGERFANCTADLGYPFMRKTGA